MRNREIADRFAEVARLLEAQEANQYRVQAWRAGAETIRALPRPVAEILETEGIDGLVRLPTIGAALARSARELVETGQLRQLERLQGTVDGWRVLATVPGIGPTLAERIHDALGIETLEELEGAAHDGRLATIEGVGAKRLRGIREALASRLRTRGAPARADGSPGGAPDVGEMLDVDREYREQAAAGRLPKIAPRRFNPTHERWLPVLHTARGKRQYTALFSNTARAHAAHKTHEWVVLYHDDGASERQHTVITATRGPLKGARIIPGLEAECARWYAEASGKAGRVATGARAGGSQQTGAR